MKKVFKFGKIDFNNTSKKINSVTIEVELINKENQGFVYSASGNVWNIRHTDIEMGGQCLDEIKKLIPNNETFNFIHDMWSKYHLNNMNAGTIEQENALRDAVKNGILLSYGANNYNETIKYLDSLNLNNDYKYGSAWLFREIPEQDLKKIIELLS